MKWKWHCQKSEYDRWIILSLWLSEFWTFSITSNSSKTYIHFMIIIRQHTQANKVAEVSTQNKKDGWCLLSCLLSFFTCIPCHVLLQPCCLIKSNKMPGNNPVTKYRLVQTSLLSNLLFSISFLLAVICQSIQPYFPNPQARLETTQVVYYFV